MRSLWDRSIKTMMLLPYGTVIVPYYESRDSFAFKFPKGFRYHPDCGHSGSLAIIDGTPDALGWILARRKDFLK